MNGQASCLSVMITLIEVFVKLLIRDEFDSTWKWSVDVRENKLKVWI